MKFLFALIAVDTFRDANHGHVLDAKFPHDLGHGADLSGPPVDQQKIGPLTVLAVGIFFFKRLSVNKLLKRMVIAVGSAIALVVASSAFAAAFGG